MSEKNQKVPQIAHSSRDGQENSAKNPSDSTPNETKPSKFDDEQKMDSGALFEKFIKIVRHLRAPGGCPWDRKQTHKSLRPYLIEEVYELVDSIDQCDYDAMKEELGDILLHILFHTDIRAEAGDFDIYDVISTVMEKLVRRHPHVFGDTEVSGSDEVLHNWENIKLSERQQSDSDASLLDGIPRSMSALLVAQRMQEKAARIGFDWNDVLDVWKKLNEEIGELKSSIEQSDDDGIEDELGDILFAIVNLARFLNVNAEMALRHTNEKFARRFRFIEKKLREQGIENPTLKVMDAFWEEAKKI